jgi:hypothetical protein
MGRTIRSAHFTGTIYLQHHHAVIGESNVGSVASQSQIQRTESSISRIIHVTLSAPIARLLIVIM